MTHSTEPAIYARGLTKRFVNFTAVDHVDFDVHSGETFGLLGPNGAGKTSIMRMIGCTSSITAGDLRVMGLDPRTESRAIKSRLGVVPQQDNLDLEMTVCENLLMYARYFDIPAPTAKHRALELLKFVHLSERADAEVERLSGGMKRRLSIARGLINDPAVILLDEPTTGLDPQARHVIWEQLHHLKKRGATIVLTTHYMDEAERLCDRVVIMEKGKIVCDGSPLDLIARHSTPEVVELRIRDAALLGAAGLFEGIAERIDFLSDRILIYTADSERALQQVRAFGISVDATLVRRSTMEDVFLHLTGRTPVE